MNWFSDAIGFLSGSTRRSEELQLEQVRLQQINAAAGDKSGDMTPLLIVGVVVAAAVLLKDQIGGSRRA